MFNIFHFLLSHMVCGIINPFSQIFIVVFGEKKCPISTPFLLTVTLTSRRCSFGRLLNPDWSIQISGAPTICKENSELNVK